MHENVFVHQEMGDRNRMAKRMDVRMTEVAKRLGLSKATVSLAVNGRPGVNAETRQRIFDCIEEIRREQQESSESSFTHVITVVVINHQGCMVYDPQFDLMSGVMAEFSVQASARSCRLNIIYYNETEDNAGDIVRECGRSDVIGVIIFGAEMTTADRPLLKAIMKPMVLYDYRDLHGSFSSVCIDNRTAVMIAVDTLFSFHPSTVRYFATSTSFFNFRERRSAFFSAMSDHGIPVQRDDIIRLGVSIPEMQEALVSWLDSHPLPEAALLENYSVQIAMLGALKQLGIPRKRIVMAGIDELPDYITGAGDIHQIIIPHSERAAISMDLLDREIDGKWKVKTNIAAIPRLKAAAGG